MPSITKLPITITQTSGGKYQTFNHPNRIRYHDNNAATCHVGGKNATLNRPSTLTCTKFQTGIPTGAEVTQVTVRLKHSKSPYNSKDCNVQAPTISLIDNNGKVLKSRKAQAPTGTPTENSVLFNFNVAYIHYNVINSNNFGVRIDYPSNSNDNEGDINVYYVEIHVAYKLSKYSLKLNHISGAYNGDTYTMKLDVSNINQTTYDPTITLTAPTGFSFVRSHLENGAENSGYQCTVVNPTTLSILVGFGKNRSNRTIILEFEANFTYGTGIEYLDKTFNVTESVNQWTASKTVRITKTRPVDPTVDPAVDPAPPTSDSTQTETITQYVSVYVNEEFDINITMPETAYDDLPTDYFAVQFIGEHGFFTFKVNGVPPETGSSFTIAEVNSQTSFTVKATPSYNGVYTIKTRQRDSEGHVFDCQEFIFNVRPREENLPLPQCSILTLSEEECNRLGTGYNYTAQTFLKTSNGFYLVNDWYKNYRIGVFNNAIASNIQRVTYTDTETGEIREIVSDPTDYTTLSVDDIINNAEYWSPCPTEQNTYTNLECQFVYNEDYPVYIIITGDYNVSGANRYDITHTEPVIIETEAYNGRETNGTYPTPILNTISNDDSAEMNITALNNASTLIAYDLPLDEDYGTNTDIAIRGLEVTGTIESNTDNLIIYATLKNSKNETRQRSLILDETQTVLTDTNQFSIGGIGDLWGFTTLDIKNLEDWETHLTISNSIMDNTGQINYKNLQLIIYIEHIEGQNVRTYINGEDLSYYGVFITDLKIPEGLKTDTDYINVNGTDVNDPFRQNIKEKTIEIDFEIGDCDLEGSTNSLRALTKLLVNERDQYNRPIPKRLEFSHYPDVYWEYILEDTLTTDLDVNTYTVKAKLVVPAGTSYDKVATKTNTVGYINGLAHIRPVIQFKPNSQHISLKETITEQEFQMSYPLDEWTGKVVEVDCDNRIVLLKNDDDDDTGTDITAYTDFNSDWFTILGEYDFTSDGCAIISVAYQERW